MNAVGHANICADTYNKNNERAGLNVFELIPHNFSARSPFSLKRRTHSSTPCDREENSLDSTFLCKNSISSVGKVTVKECFLRSTIKTESTREVLSIYNNNACNTGNIPVEESTHGKQHTDSESSESKSRDNRRTEAHGKPNKKIRSNMYEMRSGSKSIFNRFRTGKGMNAEVSQ